MIKNKIQIAACISCLVFSTTFAFAGANSIQQKPRVSHAHLATNSAAPIAGLIEIGTRDRDRVHSRNLQGFANNLPLIDVLRQLSPRGWVIKKREGSAPLDVNMLVSWRGGKTWFETLGQISKDNGFKSIVNWHNNTVHILAVNPVERVFNAPVQDSNNQNEVEGQIFRMARAQTENKGMSGSVKKIENRTIENKTESEVTIKDASAKEQPTTNVAATLIINEWEKRAGISLRENVENWANVAGYRVVWLGANYQVDHKRVLTGGFSSELGPIHRLSIDYGPGSRVEIPLSFKFYSDNTLVVEDWAFEQTGISSGSVQNR